ncbi:MAG: deoxyguanosinetriphosphate triphosphohydrolase [Candidatus Omnitrophica bacterium]|nr:deoxyguanosinetriphosphate triphosphohydrolase [Candidatus Omnitrophota bacterium]
MRSREDFQNVEEKCLASYAIWSSQSQGRKYPEKEHDLRTPYQRDRDRIIHSTAFRRLEYKTQVFVNHEGDHYRTRLTHSLETSQIARTISRTLSLNEDLVEVIALAHDMGHGPFGHAGEWALQDLMKDHGGFEHNTQCIRIVEHLEESFSDFPGLNLTYETIEGLKKHPEHFYADKKKRFRSLEADLVDVADEIAYSSHDLDDGLRSALIDEEQAAGIFLWKDAIQYIEKSHKKMTLNQRKRMAIRLIVNRLVTDVVAHSQKQIEKSKIKTREDVQKLRSSLIGYSPEMKKHVVELKRFLFQELYQHYRVIRMTDKGQRFLKELFHVYLQKPAQLPPEVQVRAKKEGVHRAICDYLAGMTDRFALDEYKRFFEPYERV